jgi:hypothetical protein
MGTALAERSVAGFGLGERVRFNDQASWRDSDEVGVVVGYGYFPGLRVGFDYLSWYLLLWVMWENEGDCRPVHPCWLEHNSRVSIGAGSNARATNGAPGNGYSAFLEPVASAVAA